MRLLFWTLSALLLLGAVFANPTIEDTTANVCPNGFIRKDISFSENLIIDSAFASRTGISNHINKDLRAVLTVFYKLDGMRQTDEGLFQLWKGRYFFRLYKEGALVHLIGGDVQADGVVITFRSADNHIHLRVYHGSTRIYATFKNVGITLTGASPLTDSLWAAMAAADSELRYLENSVQMIGSLKAKVDDIDTQICAPKETTTLCPKEGCDCGCDSTGNCRGMDASFDLLGDFPTFRLVPSWCACRGGSVPSESIPSESMPVPSEVEASSEEKGATRRDGKGEEPAPPPIEFNPPELIVTCPYFQIELTQICEYVNATFCKKSVTSFSALSVDDSVAGTWVLSGSAAITDNKNIGATSVYFRLTIVRLDDDHIELSWQLNQAGNFWQWVPFQLDRLVFTFRVTGDADFTLTSSGISGQFTFGVSGEAQIPNEKQILEAHDASAELVIRFPQLKSNKGSSSVVTLTSTGTSDEVLLHVGFTRDSFTKENLLIYGPVLANIKWSDPSSAGSVAISESIPSVDVSGSIAVSGSVAVSVDPNAREEGSAATTINSWIDRILF